MLRNLGAEVLCYPANFSMKTGEMHWDLLRRMRAVDTQTYFLACGSATNVGEQDVFQSWAHSGVIDPWGKIVASAEHEETILYSTIDLKEVEDVRNSILVSQHRRDDLYKIESKV